VFTISPPSTTISDPVMNEASSEAKKLTVFATSADCPKRFNKIFSPRADPKPCTSSFSKPTFPYKGVSIGPGETAFTLIFLGALEPIQQQKLYLKIAQQPYLQHKHLNLAFQHEHLQMY
jgi:hypothetical protein